MKKIGISMRVDVIPDRNERRDSLDQRVCQLVLRLGFLPAPVPNLSYDVGDWLSESRVEALILTGGNDLVSLGGDAPERDATESEMLAWARARDAGVLGICRGAQLIAQTAGARLERIAGHAGGTHELHGRFSGRVPSHHHWCIRSLSAGLEAIACAPDGSIEALQSTDGRLLGLMWHPERVAHARPEDDQAIRAVLEGVARS